MDIQDEKSDTVALRVARWGNSLAVRLPVDYVRRSQLRDGDTLLLAEAADGTLSLVPRKPFDRIAFADRLRKQSARLKMGSSVVAQLRGDARY